MKQFSSFMKRRGSNYYSEEEDYNEDYYSKKRKMSDGGLRTVYVGNLAWSVGWQDLKDLMKDVGQVEHVEVLEYRDGRKTGSAVVRFKTEEAAEKAIEEMSII